MTKATGRNYRMANLEVALERIARASERDWPGYTAKAVAYELGTIAKEALEK